MIYTMLFFSNHQFLAMFKANDSNSPYHVGQLQEKHPSA